MPAEDYVGPVGHEKKFHKTHFPAIKVYGGHEKVKVRTADGFAFMSRIVAEEEGYEIISEKRSERRESAEVTNGTSKV